MTGFRASPMRRRDCVLCHTKFVPKRLDAEFCSNRCRTAAHRKKQIRLEAESVFKTTLQIAENAHNAAHRLERHKYWAMQQNLGADMVGHKHIRFIGIQRGILAIHAKREDDLPWPVPWKPKPWSGMRRELKHDPANPVAGDPEVIEAVVDALRYEPLGGSFIQREFEKECQALLRIPVHRISLFTYDPDWINKMERSALALWSEDWDVPDQDGVRESHGDDGIGELLAGGGYQIEKAK
jgi:hypothetical protein